MTAIESENRGQSWDKVDAIRNCDKASFCVIDKDDVQPEKYTTYFRSVIAFGRIRIIEDEVEKYLVIDITRIRMKPYRKKLSMV